MNLGSPLLGSPVIDSVLGKNSTSSALFPPSICQNSACSARNRNRSRSPRRYPSKSSPTHRITSYSTSPGLNSTTDANRRTSVKSIGELNCPTTRRSTPNHFAVVDGPRQSNHSAGSSQSQNARASSYNPKSFSTKLNAHCGVDSRGK